MNRVIDLHMRELRRWKITAWVYFVISIALIVAYASCFYRAATCQ